MAEVFIGKVGKGNPVGAVEALAKKTKSSRNWNLVAYSGILASLIIAGYYAVIAGLVINYGFIAAAGFVGTDPGVVYAQEISSFWEMTFWFSIFLIGSGIVVGFGIEKGIESAMRILLPLLFVLVILMVGYGAVRGDMPAALDYLFSWKADQFNPGTVQAAVGQAFFSLSIGMGTLMAFGSYMPKSQQVSKSSVIVVTADTGVALFAGLAIFPLVFFFALDPTAGTELVFKTMTTAFAEMGLFGQFIGSLFYFLLAVAAFSSMISILEPSVVFVSEKFNFSRFKS
jgi:NSS family neurotransmitter:Na+ symporter